MSRPLGELYGTLFLDCPPGISLSSENVLRAADGVVVHRGAVFERDRKNDSAQGARCLRSRRLRLGGYGGFRTCSRLLRNSHSRKMLFLTIHGQVQLRT
jgi:hypothetical protein